MEAIIADCTSMGIFVDMPFTYTSLVSRPWVPEDLMPILIRKLYYFVFDRWAVARVQRPRFARYTAANARCYLAESEAFVLKCMIYNI